MDEDVEVRDEFYFYESRNGKYSMWFPQDFYIEKDNSFYQSNEELEVGRILSHESAESDESIQLNYRGWNHENQSTIESRFKDLLEALSFESEYEEIKKDDKTIYYGSSYQELIDSEVVNMDPNLNYPNAYFCLVFNEDANQFVTLRYLISCSKEECTDSKEKLDAFIEQILKSISFN